MRSDDPQANNIFSRLISYSPRVTEPLRKRTALEDFYTEALAWCLLNSEKFRKGFFELVQNAAGAPPLSLDKTPIEVHTQWSFDIPEEEETGENEEPSPGRRRFDLVIHSSGTKDFVIVVENKIKWAFTEYQIPSYRKELHNGPRFSAFDTKILILLSPTGRVPKEYPDVTPLQWSAVQKELARAADFESARHAQQPILSHPQSICAQLADFLKSKGLVFMSIPKANDQTLRSCIDGMKLRESLETILLNARAEYAKHKLSRRISFDAEDNGECWLGLYSKDSDFLYVGFKLTGLGGKPDFQMLVQAQAPNARSRVQQRLQKLGGRRVQEGTNSYIWLEQRIPGSEFAGDADKIRGWFDERLSAILQR
jgi:hypothetical protein